MTDTQPRRPLAAEAHASQFQRAGILLVEDNLSDVRLTVELLRDARLANRLQVIGDGDEALAHLHVAGIGPGSDPLPDIVLLDLALPGLDGREVLARIRADPRLAHLLVFVLTASVSHNGLVRAEGIDADGYLEKPIDLDAFVDVVTHHERFWLELVCTPVLPAL